MAIRPKLVPGALAGIAVVGALVIGIAIGASPPAKPAPALATMTQAVTVSASAVTVAQTAPAVTVTYTAPAVKLAAVTVTVTSAMPAVTVTYTAPAIKVVLPAAAPAANAYPASLEAAFLGDNSSAGTR